MQKKFAKGDVAAEGMSFLEASGFMTDKGELVLQDVAMVAEMQQKIADLIADEPNRLERERQRVKQQANERFRSKSFLKQQELKKNIKKNHEDQIQQMKDGTYHIGKNIHERKGG